MRWVYYNEFDPFAASWLRELIRAGELPDGEVDDRSILEVEPDDVRSFRQCHFFAGIGGWPHALELAGFPEEREIWTASLPCQPLSVAGCRKGDADERHLWPAFYRLVAVCRPAVIVGEQVASADGREWLAGVRFDLEAAGYACGAASLPACAVGAPHRRERLYWGALANPNGSGSGAGRGDDGEMRGLSEAQRQPEHGSALLGRGGGSSGVAHATGGGPLEPIDERERAEGVRQTQSEGHSILAHPERAGVWGQSRNDGGASRQVSGEVRQQRSDDSAGGGMGDALSTGLAEQQRLAGIPRQQSSAGTREAAQRTNASSGFWDDAEWRVGADGKARRVEPGIRLLAHGVPNRVGLLRGFGNAIVPQAAALFVRALL